MEYRKLGESGLLVSRVTLGCMSWGDPARIDLSAGDHPWVVDEDSAREIVREAIELGVNCFDTANIYASGSSEEITGRLVKEFARREDLVIATKVYFGMRQSPGAGGLSRKAIQHEAEQSLRRLGTDYIDLYQVHRWDPMTPIDETMEALSDLVRAGKVRYLGASSMFAWQLAKAQHSAETHGGHRFISMQNHYNLLYREEEREMLPYCENAGVGVMPWSPLARGRLSRPWGTETSRAQTDLLGQEYYGESDRAVVDAVGRVAERHGRTHAEVSLAWLLAQPQVTSPIVGAGRVSHLQQAVSALDLRLTVEDIHELESPYIPHQISGHS